MKRSELIEILAEVEHDQWISWSQNIANTDNISSKRLFRWRNDCWMSYKDLSEEMKEHDRVWARKVLDKVEGCGMLPPRTSQYTDHNDFHGEWSSITDDFKYEWEDEDELP